MKVSRRTLAPLYLVPLALGALPSCKAAPAAAPAPAALPVKQVTLATVGLDTTALDRTVDPCEDFYQFACGNWVKNTTIPGDQSRWMRSFSEIQKRNEEDLKAILDALAAAASQKSPEEQKLGDYYASCVDEAAVEKAGLGEVKGLLGRVAALRASLEKTSPAKPNDTAAHGRNVHSPDANAKHTHAKSDAKATSEPKTETLEQLLADLHRAGINPLFNVGSGPDDKDATTIIAQFDQAGLGLPDRDYYLDPKHADLLAYYQGHVAEMMKLGGLADADAKRAADQVVTLEKRIAEISKTRVERRDPQGMYNRIDLPGLKGLRGRLDYEAYLTALVGQAQNPTLGLKPFSKINVTSTTFFAKLSDVLGEATPEALANYLSWHILHATSSALPKAFDEENFKLVQKITGQKEQKPRWKRCVASTDGALGELLGQSYVAKRFLPESKEAVRRMLKAIREALEHRLPELAWMDDATRAQAKQKIAKMEDLIGYPDKWQAYPFSVDRSSYAGNLLRASVYEFERHLAKVESPVDRTEWYMSPQTVNAYYDGNKNQMVFPAGILQPPFFSAAASDAVNLGSIGMVVGHELTHGFDDAGSQYDGDGNLKSWWTPEVRAKFDQHAACIADQYGNYEVLPGVKQNGKLTLGENIADNAGLMLAYQALAALRANAKERLVAEGFNEQQQLFLSAGQVWCSKATDELTKLRAATDPHSQPRWRVNGSVRNLPAFAEAFQCKEGSAMHPKSTCSVW
jgi:putative endopeptidase